MTENTVRGLPMPPVVSPADWQVARDRLTSRTSSRAGRTGGAVDLFGGRRRLRHLLDLTPDGRQEEWEDEPAGWPQSPTYGWGSDRDDQ